MNLDASTALNGAFEWCLHATIDSLLLPHKGMYTVNKVHLPNEGSTVSATTIHYSISIESAIATTARDLLNVAVINGVYTRQFYHYNGYQFDAISGLFAFSDDTQTPTESPVISPSNQRVYTPTVDTSMSLGTSGESGSGKKHSISTCIKIAFNESNQ